MDELDDPYSPGAGVPPQELSGRDAVIKSAEIAINRAKNAKTVTNHVLTGLRGVGKTVLLVEFEKIAEELDCHPTNVIEADGNKTLASLLLPQILRIMIKLDRVKRAEYNIQKSMEFVRAVASAFSVKIGSVEVGVSRADITGDFASDLSDVFIDIGNIAKERKTSIVIIIDEIQLLAISDLAALIMALHKVSQRKLPILFLGAGLPFFPKFSGEAKPYAERMFKYTTIDRLDREDAIRAIVEPAAQQDVEYTQDALDLIISETHGYPYYLQLWGSESWKAAISSPIEVEDVQAATIASKVMLDNSIFATRLQRLTDRQQEYARAMADLPLPARSSEVANALGMTIEQAAAMRDELIKKGIAYSPKRGSIDFTVPLFDEFLRRQDAPAKKSARTPSRHRKKPTLV